MNFSVDPRSDRFLADLDRIDDRMSRIQREISSGYRVSRPSDEPGQVIDILQLRSDVSRATTINTNLDRVTAEVDTSEAAMRVAVQLVERARTLAAEAATSTATNRQAVALEVQQISQQIVDITKTVSEGRFVFSGDKDQSLTYAFDWSQPGGVVQLTTTTNTRQVEDVNGSRFNIAKSSSELFDARNSDGTVANENVFYALHALGTALENDDATQVQSAAALISDSLDHLGRQLTFYGHVQNRIENAKTLTLSSLNARKEELSRAQDTDVAQALVDLSTIKVHHEAALGAQSQQPRSSLFDYLA
jgi:flagellar hook-associated protein 3 FlgL